MKNTFGPKLTESENRLIKSTSHLLSNRNQLGVIHKKQMKKGHASLNSRKEMANEDIVLGVMHAKLQSKLSKKKIYVYIINKCKYKKKHS